MQFDRSVGDLVGNNSKLKSFIFEADDVRASHWVHVKTSKIKRIFDHVLQKQLATNGIKSQHHRKATVYKTIVSDQPILVPGCQF